MLPSLDLAPPTVESYTWALNRVEAELGTVRLATLTPEHVEAAFARWASEGTSRSSLIKIRSVLNRVLTYAERRGLAARNIAKLVELPATAQRTEPGRALTVEQAKSLLDAAREHRLEALFVTMLMLGLRPGEALGLSWHNVDLDAGIVHVRQSLKLHHGPPDGHRSTQDKQISAQPRRPPRVIDAIRARRVHQAEDRLLAGPAWSDMFPGLVFTTTVCTAISLSNLRRDLETLTARAGLGRWHPHELRHSAASIMSASGVPLEEVADMLGHDGTRMTALVYRHAVTLRSAPRDEWVRFSTDLNTAILRPHRGGGRITDDPEDVSGPCRAHAMSLPAMPLSIPRNDGWGFAGSPNVSEARRTSRS